MEESSPLAVFWRRKWIIVLATLAALLGTYVLTRQLPPVYRVSSTLLVVAQSDTTQSFDSIQAAQVVGRSYAALLRGQQVRGRVTAELRRARTAPSAPRPDVRQLTDTQLLEISIEDEDPVRAQRVANTYASVFVNYAQGELSATTRTQVLVADPAARPLDPVRPRPVLYAGVAAVFGFLGGLALAALAERLDRRFASAEDVARRLDTRLLGRLPPRRVPRDTPAFKEAVRVLLTNLRLASPEDSLREVIAIASEHPDAGASLIAVELGQAAADGGILTLVVDADLRRSETTRYLLGEEEATQAPGLVELLNGAVDAQDAVVAVSGYGEHPLCVLPAGRGSPPGDLWRALSRSTGDVLSELTGLFDLVIFDCPPIEADANTLVIAASVDGLVLVVDLPTSSPRGTQGALRQLATVNASVLGVAVNRDDAASTLEYGSSSEGKARSSWRMPWLKLPGR